MNEDLLKDVVVECLVEYLEYQNVKDVYFVRIINQKWYEKEVVFKYV